MATETKTRSAPRKASDPKKKKRRPPAKRQKQKRVRPRLYNEFKPDAPRVSPFKPIRFTPQQRLDVGKWVLYGIVCLLALILQDSIMSRVRFFGATTELVVGVIALIAIQEGCEVGSVFAFIASGVYYFSGSAHGAYSVGALTLLCIAISMFRQKYWTRNAASIIVSGSLIVFAYEFLMYAVGIFLGLTRWSRLFGFLLTAAFTTVWMIPLYFLLNRIGLIGGNKWKE